MSSKVEAAVSSVIARTLESFFNSVLEVSNTRVVAGTLHLQSKAELLQHFVEANPNFVASLYRDLLEKIGSGDVIVSAMAIHDYLRKQFTDTTKQRVDDFCKYYPTYLALNKASDYTMEKYMADLSKELDSAFPTSLKRVLEEQGFVVVTSLEQLNQYMADLNGADLPNNVVVAANDPAIVARVEELCNPYAPSAERQLMNELHREQIEGLNPRVLAERIERDRDLQQDSALTDLYYNEGNEEDVYLHKLANEFPGRSVTQITLSEAGSLMEQSKVAQTGGNVEKMRLQAQAEELRDVMSIINQDPGRDILTYSEHLRDVAMEIKCAQLREAARCRRIPAKAAYEFLQEQYKKITPEPTISEEEKVVIGEYTSVLKEILADLTKAEKVSDAKAHLGNLGTLTKEFVSRMTEW